MAQLFTQYSISEIILFLIVLAIAIKRFIEFADWAKKRTQQAVEEDNVPKQLKKIIQKHEQELNNIKKVLNTLQDSINLLIESDKDDIKQSITKDHHYFCYQLKSIDDYSLDCIEKRFSHYEEEGGNSFVQVLMQEIRALPRKLDKQNR